jgi:hypothetical protein
LFGLIYYFLSTLKILLDLFCLNAKAVDIKRGTVELYIFLYCELNYVLYCRLCMSFVFAFVCF